MKLFLILFWLSYVAVSDGLAQSNIETVLKGDASQAAEPMLITSDTFRLDSRNQRFYYRDNVEVVKGDLVITADLMTGRYDKNNNLEEIICENNVVITRGDRLRATSNKATYDIPKDRIVLTEGPELNDRGNVLTADKVTLFVKEDKSEADGHVRVKVFKSDEQGGGLMGKMKSGGGSKSASEKKK